MATRPATVTSPLGKDVLLLFRMVAREELGRLSEFELELLSTDPKVKLEDLIGKGITVALELPNGKTRFFNGLCTRFSQSGRIGRYTQYQATLRPWLWLLTRTADCRIFPDPKEAESKTVPDIIKDVFRKNGFSDFKERLNGAYKAREYCVQYRETDFNFVSRLMEEEGIYYYLKHEDGKHFVVLSDSTTSHDPIPGCETVQYMAATLESAARVDHVSSWQMAQELQTGLAVLNDHDFEVPRADHTVKSSISRSHAHAKFEVYDYPGFHVGAYSARGEGTSGDGDAMERGQAFARTRIEELQTDHEQILGSGNVRGLAVGGTFKLKEFHREDQNDKEHLVVSTVLQAQIGGYEGIDAASNQTLFSCQFSAIPGKVPFRSRRLTPRPTIPGPQTATVVGKSGEEIWTDVHGRVKVQFHWDRKGGQDESSSCWVRVSSPWAGKNWGAVHIPRMGHEVVVEFLEGNPDRPIITGSVYNGQNKPPYKLPDNQTQSGIKSRSTKEGSAENFNEIRFEDKKGEEQLFIHAEKNQDIEVEKNETHWVGVDRTKTIDHDETTHVKNNRTEAVDKEESITIGGNRTESVAKNETISIDGSRTETVAKDESITIEGGRTESVTKDESITINGGRTESVAKDESVSIAGKRTKDVSKDESVSIGQKYSQTVGKDAVVDVGKTFTLQAADEIVFKSGSASITLKKSGDISIKGDKIKIEASGDLVQKGSKITQN
jgi:type VI secretion system secreted protein VgrG